MFVAAAAGACRAGRARGAHLIVIIGENRTFDHVCATYQPARGETLWNQLALGEMLAVQVCDPPAQTRAVVRRWQRFKTGQ